MAVISQVINDRFALYNGDCMEVIPTLPDESIGFSVYSPPFAELYNYSSDDRDMSNCASYDQFLEHYDFLVSQISRVTKPGRLSAVHCMELKKDNQGLRDFPGDIIRIYERYGMEYFGRVIIWKEPLRVAIRTRTLRLKHGQLVKDSSLCGVAGPDTLLFLRKRGECAEPIAHPDGLTTYAGESDERKRAIYGHTPIPSHLAKYQRGWAESKTNKWAHWIWQQYASPVWMDIRQGRVLPYKKARENPEEKHVCPLQLDVIERALTLYSNPGDTVLTPFLGVGSEAYMAVRMGRRALGIELKTTYFNQAVANVTEALTAPVDENHPDMFDGSDFDGEEEEIENVDNEEMEPTP